MASDPASPRVGVVLPAAGSGTRFGARKQFLPLGGKPLLLHAVETFASVEATRAVVVVAPRDDLVELERLLEAVEPRPGLRLLVVEGGARRQDSVLAGLRALPEDCEQALVHDAARPLLRTRDVELLVAELVRGRAVVLGHPSTDSVQRARESGAAGSESPVVAETLPREEVWLVQTPQGARRDTLIRAIETAGEQGFTGTDEASFLLRAGEEVHLVEGPRDNLKVTFPGDLELAEFLLSRRRERAGGGSGSGESPA